MINTDYDFLILLLCLTFFFPDKHFKLLYLLLVPCWIYTDQYITCSSTALFISSPDQTILFNSVIQMYS